MTFEYRKQILDHIESLLLKNFLFILHTQCLRRLSYINKIATKNLLHLCSFVWYISLCDAMLHTQERSSNYVSKFLKIKSNLILKLTN